MFNSILPRILLVVFLLNVIGIFNVYGGSAAPVSIAFSTMIPQAATASASSSKTVRKSSKKKKKKKKPPYRPVTITLLASAIEERNIYASMQKWNNAMCIKEVPFLLALHRAYNNDRRLYRGDTLAIRNETVRTLLNRAADRFSLPGLLQSSISNLDSMFIYKEKRHRKDAKICNMVLHVVPGEYEIPNTGASIILPERIAGSVSYNVKTGKMVVYIHTGGIQLQLPGYAKALTFGLLKDMDIGFAELERVKGSWTARLLYVGEERGAKKKGWTFNITECNKIRPY